MFFLSSFSSKRVLSLGIGLGIVFWNASFARAEIKASGNYYFLNKKNERKLDNKINSGASNKEIRTFIKSNGKVNENVSADDLRANRYKGGYYKDSKKSGFEQATKIDGVKDKFLGKDTKSNKSKTSVTYNYGNDGLQKETVSRPTVKSSPASRKPASKKK